MGYVDKEYTKRPNENYTNATMTFNGKLEPETGALQKISIRMENGDNYSVGCPCGSPMIPPCPGDVHKEQWTREDANVELSGFRKTLTDTFWLRGRSLHSKKDNIYALVIVLDLKKPSMSPTKSNSPRSKNGRGPLENDEKVNKAGAKRSKPECEGKIKLTPKTPTQRESTASATSSKSNSTSPSACLLSELVPACPSRGCDNGRVVKEVIKGKVVYGKCRVCHPPCTASPGYGSEDCCSPPYPFQKSYLGWHNHCKRCGGLGFTREFGLHTHCKGCGGTDSLNQRRRLTSRKKKQLIKRLSREYERINRLP